MTPIIAHTHRHYEAGASVLREYLRWMRDERGVDLIARQPRIVDEAWRTSTIYGPPHGALVVAFAGFRPVGTVGIAGVAPGVAELRRMYVRPALRGRGIGTALLTCGIEAARRRGFEHLRLDAAATGMSAAQRLYWRAGFREVAAAPAPRRHAAVRLRLALAAG